MDSNELVSCFFLIWCFMFLFDLKFSINIRIKYIHKYIVSPLKIFKVYLIVNSWIISNAFVWSFLKMFFLLCNSLESVNYHRFRQIGVITEKMRNSAAHNRSHKLDIFHPINLVNFMRGCTYVRGKWQRNVVHWLEEKSKQRASKRNNTYEAVGFTSHFKATNQICLKLWVQFPILHI